MGHHFIAAALGRMITIFARTHLVEVGIVGVETTFEAASKTNLRVKNHGTYKSGGMVAVAAQDLGSIGQLRGQGDLEVVHQMKLWIGSSKDAGM